MKRLLSVAWLLIFCHSAAAGSKAWPAAEKSAQIASCRVAILESGEQAYMKEHNLKALPDGFREVLAGGPLKSILASCDCMYDELEKQWSYDFYMSNPEKISNKVRELMSSTCAPRSTQ